MSASDEVRGVGDTCEVCGRTIGFVHICHCTFSPDVRLVIANNPTTTGQHPVSDGPETTEIE